MRKITTIYLDIDGTILQKDGSFAYMAPELIKYCTDNFDTYWLTTHCKGDSKNTLTYIKPYFPEEIHPYLEKIKPTNWGAMKTDGIDFSKNFIWLDDYLMGAEFKVLEEKKVEASHLMINLEENPFQLEEILKFLRD